MKFYEKLSIPEFLMPNVPTFARLDGKNFHNFTKGLERPFDHYLNYVMAMLTRYLVTETNAKMGYTQSDEITLTWLSEDPKSQIWFDGKTQKINSVLASIATYKFNELKAHYLESKKDIPAYFDCRVWTVPSIEEGANVFVWRELDATRNSIQMAARANFSHKECEKKSTNELQEMLFKIGINWNDYPSKFKRGIYIHNKKEILPNKEKEARIIYTADFPIITTIENRAKVIYYGEKPILKENS